MEWAKVAKGALTVSSLPSGQLLEITKASVSGPLHVINLSDRIVDTEESICNELGIPYYWFPIRNGKPPNFIPDLTNQNTVYSIGAASEKIQEILSHEGGFVFLHCLAGRHRSMLVAYCTMLRCGLSSKVALYRLQRLNPEAFPMDPSMTEFAERNFGWKFFSC